MNTFYFTRVKDTANCVIQLYKIGNIVFSFFKLNTTNEIHKIIIPEEYRPKTKVAFLLHSTTAINTVTILVTTDGEINVEATSYKELHLGFNIWKTN